MTYDLVIKNGRVISGGADFTGDVAASGEKIAALGQGLQGKTEIQGFTLPEHGSRVTVREFHVPIAGELTITLTPVDSGDTTVLCGVEIIQE